MSKIKQLHNRRITPNCIQTHGSRLKPLEIVFDEIKEIYLKRLNEAEDDNEPVQIQIIVNEIID